MMFCIWDSDAQLLLRRLRSVDAAAAAAAAALYTHSETSGGTSSLFDEHKDSQTNTNTLSGLSGLFHDNTRDTRNFSGGHQ